MRPQELNLLIIFDAIMTEGSISRAADRLSMTQPAVSNAVSRMRVAWKDELFVKQGRNIKPTLKADNMWQQIKQPINELSGVIAPKSFDPATAQRTFRISAADIVVEMMSVRLRKLIEQEAPGINIHMMPYTIINTNEVLDDATVDLVIGASNTMPGTIRAKHLFHPDYVCVMRPDHPLTKGKLTLEKFAAAEHLLVSLSGDTVGVTDEFLASKGLSRRIAMTVNQFSMVPDLLINSNLIAIAPLGPVACNIKKGDLVSVPYPFQIPLGSASLFWHTRQDKDQGLIWLRKHVKEIVIKAESEYRDFCNC